MELRERTVLVLGALALLQALHLLDEQRTDPSTDFAEVVLRPQPIIGIGGTVLALVAVRNRAQIARALAFTVSGLVALGFILSHGIPAETARTEPYWGDGSADVLQWLGVASILACCAAAFLLARRLPARSAAS